MLNSAGGEREGPGADVHRRSAPRDGRGVGAAVHAYARGQVRGRGDRRSGQAAVVAAPPAGSWWIRAGPLPARLPGPKGSRSGRSVIGSSRGPRERPAPGLGIPPSPGTSRVSELDGDSSRARRGRVPGGRSGGLPGRGRTDERREPLRAHENAGDAHSPGSVGAIGGACSALEDTGAAGGTCDLGRKKMGHWAGVAACSGWERGFQGIH